MSMSRKVACGTSYAGNPEVFFVEVFNEENVSYERQMKIPMSKNSI